MIWGLVAARLGEAAKKRLEPVLPPELRQRFSHAMLEDVLAALGGSQALGGVAVLAGDTEAEEVAHAYGALSIRDAEGGGLNRAVTRGAALLARQGATGVLVAMGDLPCLQPDDIDRVAAALGTHAVVAAPSRDGTGTNLLALRPTDALAFSFGPQSLAAHREAARAASLEWQEVEAAGAALDIDTPDDLYELIRSEDAGRRPGRALLLLRERLAAADEIASAGLGDNELRVAASADVDLSELGRHALSSLRLR
ncbi:MAG: 2-phospho-L-lactate guanylyltransferase [Deltaproteobacteria bacterium]